MSDGLCVFGLRKAWLKHKRCVDPDRKFVVTKGNVALMYHAPGKRREFNAFVLDKSYYGPYDETSCIDWTDDSKSALLFPAAPLL